MSEADVTYADLKFSKSAPSADHQRPGWKEKSKVSPEQVVLLVLSSLLAAAVFTLGLTVFYLMNNEVLQTLKEENEALRRNLSERNHCTIDQSTSPPPTTGPSCPNASAELLLTSPTPPTVKDDTCLKCEAGWELHGGTCYYFNKKRSSWTESRHSCRNLGGDLVKIDSREEQMFLVGRIRDLMEEAGGSFWIGLTDSAEEGRWLWVDGSPQDESLRFWFGEEPDDWKSENKDGEDCARMEPRGETPDLKTWFDLSCDGHQKSICEKAAELSSCVCV